MSHTPYVYHQDGFGSTFGERGLIGEAKKAEMAVRISNWCCLLDFISSKHLGIIMYLGKGVGTW